MRLWIDDLRDAPKGWTLAKSVTEAIRILDTQPVLEVSLDHDICHVLPQDERPPADILDKTSVLFQPISCTETFEPVARFIANDPGTIVRVHIHTSNPAGADRMVEIISSRQPHIRISRRLGKIYEGGEGDDSTVE